jgi:hypothetical protein
MVMGVHETFPCCFESGYLGTCANTSTSFLSSLVTPFRPFFHRISKNICNSLSVKYLRIPIIAPMPDGRPDSDPIQRLPPARAAELAQVLGEIRHKGLPTEVEEEAVKQVLHRLKDAGSWDDAEWPLRLRRIRKWAIARAWQKKYRETTALRGYPTGSNVVSPRSGIDDEFVAHLQAALEELDPITVQILLLRVVRKQTLKASAEALGVPLSTVHAKYKNGLKQLRTMLTDLGWDDNLHGHA